MQSFLISMAFLSFLSTIFGIWSIVSSVSLYFRYRYRIFLIVSGLLLSFLIGSIGVFSGTISSLIYGITVPSGICDVVGYIKLFGVTMQTGYQILVDIALYLNIFCYYKFKLLLNDQLNAIAISILAISSIIALIPDLLGMYNTTDYFQQLSCTPVGNNTSKWAKLYEITLLDLPSIISLLIDFYVILRIIYFYRKYAQLGSERKYIFYLLLFPLVYTFITLSVLMCSISSIYTMNRNESDTGIYTVYSKVAYSLVSIRGLLVSLVYGFQIINFQYSYGHMLMKNNEIEQSSYQNLKLKEPENQSF